MKKKLFLIASLVILAILVAAPAAVLADDPAKDYVEGPTTQCVEPGGPVILYFLMDNLDSIITFRVKAHNASYIGVSVVDCCIPGDWYRGNIVVYSGSTPMLANTTHSELCAGYYEPAPDDPSWAPDAIVPDVDAGNTMQALVTVTFANEGNLISPSGMWVKITSDADTIAIVPVPSV